MDSVSRLRPGAVVLLSGAETTNISFKTRVLHGYGQLVMIVGEPGLGKSRVLSIPIDGPPPLVSISITTGLLNRERARCENGLHCFTCCSF